MPAILFLLGTIGLVAWERVAPFLTRQGANDQLLLGGGLCLLLTSAAGLVLGTASLTSLMGRVIAPRTGQTWLLLASRRMMATPFTASRATTAVVLATFIGGAIGHVRSSYLASRASDQE